MAPKITKGILESYLKCPYKAYLKLSGQRGTVSDYEHLLGESDDEVKRNAVNRILASNADVTTGVPLTVAALRRGSDFVLDAMLDNEFLSLAFDGLKRVDEPSHLGTFHYVPMLFHGEQRFRKERRQLLEVYGSLLSQIQGRQPAKGIIWQAPDCKTTTVRLNLELRKSERVLREVKEARGTVEPPNLILNDHCQICEFRQQCHEQALQQDNLSLLRGIGEKEIKRYAKKGILTIRQLAHTFRPRRKGKRSAPRQNHRYHALQALALRDKTVYVLGTPDLPVAPVHVYLDIEGKPDDRFDYLIGMIITDGDDETRFSLWADDSIQEEQILDQFLDILKPYQHFLVFAYGGYEASFLKRIRQRTKRKAEIDRILNSLVNILSTVYSHLYFPTYSNSLKDVAHLLGFAWSIADASGIHSLVWRMRWEKSRDEQWKQRLTTYNMEDCTALRQVAAFIFTQCCTPELVHETSEFKTSPSVASVDEIDRLGAVNKRGRKEFFHADFAHINKCARFDYQRERVYVRSRKTRRTKSEKKPREYRNSTLRATQQIEITSRKCPSCGSTELSRPLKAHFGKGCFTKGKRAFDLVFTSSGIRRTIIECRASVHNCLVCGHIFVPERYERLAKHFHGLTSWAMHEHVAHRISGPMVSEMIKEFFGLTVYPAEVTRFRSMMAHQYEPCWRNLLKKILSSPVLQIDETEVKLRNGKGYVWVFTTVEEVVYMYRPTREGDFLHELLKDFNGVLVSDFYAAYDSLICPQQKCLLHLMRDMNQALLDSPFDEELQSITAPFGELLREIVSTIDEYGLKRLHLKRHDRSVSLFFASIEKRLFHSESAESLRTRLMKYRDKMFTFLDYDGVPWNNNDPENAIRRFAYYRDGNPGRLKEPGLKEYLILLSLCQTCHYKGVSFLRFLLSRERDIDVFQQRPRRKRRSPSVEIYPKGVVRPDFGGKRPIGNHTPNKTRSEEDLSK